MWSSKRGDDMDENRETNNLLLKAWLFSLPVVLLLLAAPFIMYFIVPKLESMWASQGMRPPFWGTALISTSHFVIKCWYVIVVALPVFLWLQRRGSSSPRD